MLLVIGGAYAGKRKVVRERVKQPLTWVSAYEQQDWQEGKQNWTQGTCLVLEGWEVWLKAEMKRPEFLQESPLDPLRQRFQEYIYSLRQEENERQAQAQETCHEHQLVLIILEMGNGIVPLLPEERAWRDVAGWLAQDAGQLADEVLYVWHGLPRALKSIQNL